MSKIKLHWQVLIAVGLAVVAGLATGKSAGVFGVAFYDIYAFFGTLFLNALKMLIVPLIVSSIILGISGIGSSAAVGRLGGKTVVYYLTTSLLAILLGLTIVDLVQPGIVDGAPAKDALGLRADDAAAVVERVEGRGAADLAGIFLSMVPPNIVSAAAEGQMLGLIFFSLLFGFFMMRLATPYRETVQHFWQGVFDVMMSITSLVMKFAPIGVFALVAKVVAASGLAAFKPLAAFFFAVLAGLLIHFVVTLPLLIALLGRINPFGIYRAMAPALLTAFSTSSSAATLPVTLECVEKNARVSNRVSSFVVPLGATINMDGTALYECAAAMFIAQAYGLSLGFAEQFVVVALALLTSIGVAGIPSASLVAIAVILGAIGLPAEALGLILAVDRVLDMCRTTVNVFSDACGAVVIARLEGEDKVLTR